MKEPGEPKFDDLTPDEIKRKERMETKLYLARDIDGEPNSEELQAIRQLEQELSSREDFIGIAPYGSVVAGYNTDNSDLDLIILYDNSQESRGKIPKIEYGLKQICEMIGKANNIEISPDLVGIDLEAVLSDIKRSFSGDKMNIFPRRALISLSRLAIGNKVDDYRRIIAEELHKLTKDQQEEVIADLVYALHFIDSASGLKRSSKMRRMWIHEHDEIIEKRKELWERRVRKIWGIEKE
ncbi:MAG: nucleotidyltransferase domain-containing protein [Candidatus Staskawiczbacteria bacterium]|jgi:predicted nucleotidyltransferase